MRTPTHENIAAFRDALSAQHATGAHLGDSFFAANLANALLGAGEASEAAQVLQDAFIFVEQSGERYWLAELYRVAGLIKLKQPMPDTEGAEAAYLKAIEIAKQQEARLHELRAATELAKLRKGKSSDGSQRTQIEPILKAIEGGEETREVRNAKAILFEQV